MDKIPRMSRIVRRHLIRLGRRSGEPHTALRFHIVSRLGLGLNSPQVAMELDVARSTVVRTAACFAAEGVEGLYDKRRGNGKAKVDGAFRDALAALLQRTPEHFGWMRPTWTRELLCLQMRRSGWPRVAVCTMGRALARTGRNSTPTSRETIAARRSTPYLATRGDISKAIDGGDRPLPLARPPRRDPWTRIALGDLDLLEERFHRALDRRGAEFIWEGEDSASRSDPPGATAKEESSC